MTSLTFFAEGTPAPKGSLRHVGRGRLIEQVKGSVPWKTAVMLAAAVERDRVGWTTLTGPVKVTALVVVPRPKSVRRLFPIKRSAGDSDKHARNILDAIGEAHIYADDSQVIDLHIFKRYPTDGRPPGALIRITDMEEVT